LANQKSTVERAQLKYIWAIQGSENHDMMDLSNAFLALQVLKDLPRYRERRLSDGLLLRCTSTARFRCIGFVREAQPGFEARSVPALPL
jgi:hypothetical protein